MPCPISRCLEITVTVLSAPMRKKGVGSKLAAAAPGLAASDAGPVLSIGRTLRDIDTLLRAAAAFERPLELVVGKRDRLPAQLPARTTVFRDISLDEVRDRLRGAAVVAIPLLPAERSTGQVVMFEAMALGKPVVATRAAGTNVRLGCTFSAIEQDSDGVQVTFTDGQRQRYDLVIGADGRRRPTSTDPKLWGTSNGDGGGITPPPGLLDHRPDYRRAVYGRVTEPWTARKAEPPPQTAGVRVPRSNGCTVAGGEMRCRR